jgi:poly-gamma-glutamate system protein
VFHTPPAAISLGGDEDVGGGFDPDLKNRLLGQIAATGIQLISEPDLRRNVGLRMAVYAGPGVSRRVSAFINTGGSYANLGTSALALELLPGLNTDMSLPPVDQRGVLFEMAARSVPVIHLLFIRGLALRYGLGWDPIPLSEPGAATLHDDGSEGNRYAWLIGVPFLVSVAVCVALYARSARQQTRAGPAETL